MKWLDWNWKAADGGFAVRKKPSRHHWSYRESLPRFPFIFVAAVWTCRFNIQQNMREWKQTLIIKIIKIVITRAPPDTIISHSNDEIFCLFQRWKRVKGQARKLFNGCYNAIKIFHELLEIKSRKITKMVIPEKDCFIFEKWIISPAIVHMTCTRDN